MKKRIIGIDLLRIVSMFMIMTLHTMSNGGGLLYHQVNTCHTQVILMMTFLNNIAVDLFALISGYVGLHSHHRVSRIVELWLQVVFLFVADYVFLSYLES
jgi:surface polysaccharide O-acyltransferase-like enzyme